MKKPMSGAPRTVEPLCAELLGLQMTPVAVGPALDACPRHASGAEGTLGQCGPCPRIARAPQQGDGVQEMGLRRKVQPLLAEKNQKVQHRDGGGGRLWALLHHGRSLDRGPQVSCHFCEWSSGEFEFLT